MKIIIRTLFLLLSVTTAFAADNSLGEKIYNQACHTCHNPSTAPLMSAAPVHDQAAWKKRFAGASEAIKSQTQFKTPIDYLVNSVKNGKNAMPAGGMCTNDATVDKKCTNDEYKAAIEFMSSPEKK